MALSGGCGTYKILGALTAWEVGVDFRGSTFNVSNNPSVALTVGIAADNVDRKVMFLPHVINASHAVGWAGEGTGIKLLNLSNCRVTIPECRGFATGLHLEGIGRGCQNNYADVMQAPNNKVPILLKPGDTAGWVNQNTLWVGKAGQDSGEGTAISGARGIRLAPFDVTNATTSWPNSNVFINPNIEGDGPEYHIEVAGSYNTFINPRLEATSPKMLQVGHASVSVTTDNLMLGGFNGQGVVHSSSGLVANFNKLGTRRWSSQTNSDGHKFANSTSNANPVFIVFPGSVDPEEMADTGTTNWLLKLGGQTIRGKNTGDTAERLMLDFTDARIYFGDGSDVITGEPFISRGAGTPEGSVTAPVGSLYLRVNGGAATSLYVKESGIGNTGWAAK